MYGARVRQVRLQPANPQVPGSFFAVAMGSSPLTEAGGRTGHYPQTPRSRSVHGRRTVDRCDEYNPSRRSSAATAPDSLQLSTPLTMRRCYSLADALARGSFRILGLWIRFPGHPATKGLRNVLGTFVEILGLFGV
jgi:hypothetical protein